MTLAGDDDHEGDNHIGVSSFKKSLHVRHLLLQNMGVLLLSNTVAEVENTRWESTLTNSLDPMLDVGLQHAVDVAGFDHLDAEAVRCTGGRVTSTKSVH